MHWVLLGLAIGIALWAKYFVVVLAVPLGAVPADRPRCAARARHARALCRGRGRARSWRRRICSGWCRTISCRSRYADARALQLRAGCSTTCCIRSQFAARAARLPAAGAADRGAAICAARRDDGRARAGRRLRPPHRHAAGVRAGGHGGRCCRSSPGAAPSPCGAIRFGCSSGCGSCLMRARRSTASRLARIVALWGDRVLRLRAGLRRQLRRAAGATTGATARCSFRASGSAPKCRARFRALTGRPLAYVDRPRCGPAATSPTTRRSGRAC